MSKKYILKNYLEYSTKKISYKDLNKYNYISTENMLPNIKGLTTATSVPNSGKCTLFNENNILLSNIRPYFKKLYYTQFTGGCSNDVLCFRNIQEDIVLSKYLYYLMSTDNFFDYVVSTSKGTKMPRGDKNAILQYECYIHDLPTQQHIVDIINLYNIIHLYHF